MEGGTHLKNKTTVVKTDTNSREYGVVFRHIPCGQLVRVKRRIDSSEPPTVEIVFADGTFGIVPRGYLDLHFSDEELADFERKCPPEAKF